MISAKLEELLGKTLLLGVFGWTLIGQGKALAGQLMAPDRPDNFVLLLTAKVLSLLFVAMVIALTIRRLPPRQSAAGWEPRAAAIGGTFLLIVLIWLPMGTPSAAALVVANVLMLVGTAGSIWSLHYLGRSFAVLAAARALVTGGPYGIVRHPLYLTEAITMIGVVVMHWSWAAVLVGVAQMLLQYRRMQHEERILRDAFPEYEAYAERVPMVVPGPKAAVARA